MLIRGGDDVGEVMKGATTQICRARRHGSLFASTYNDSYCCSPASPGCLPDLPACHGFSALCSSPFRTHQAAIREIVKIPAKNRSFGRKEPFGFAAKSAKFAPVTSACAQRIRQRGGGRWGEDESVGVCRELQSRRAQHFLERKPRRRRRRKADKERVL